MYIEEDKCVRVKDIKDKKNAKIRELLNKKDLTEFELDLIMNDLL